MAKTIDIYLPKLGESVMEGTIIEWLKRPGDHVEKDDLLVTVGTDKVDSELPSEFEGELIACLVKENDTVAVGTPIAQMRVADEVVVGQEKIDRVPSEKINSFSNHLDENEITPPAANREFENETSLGFLSPVVRKMAAEWGMELTDLQQISHKRKGQRLRKQDLLDWKKRQSPLLGAVELPEPEEGDELEKISRIRQLTADHLQRSFQRIPHVTTVVLADVTELVNFRQAVKERFKEKNGVKLTYTHLMFALMVEALQKYPRFNAWFSGSEILYKKDINLGFATALPNGNLLVPNVKKAQIKNLVELVRDMQEKSEAARANSLKPEALQHTTFTMSNTGIFGSLFGTPIISEPQTAVLALGEIRDENEVIEVQSEIRLRKRKKMYLSLSYDHRIIDGALASRFLSSYARSLKETDFTKKYSALI